VIKDTLNIQIGITSSLYKTSTQFLASVVRFSGSGNSNMLSKILREPRELPWQPNLGKIRQNWTDVGFVQDMETIFGYMVGLFRVGELKNMLRKILREPTPLLWQPNLGKNKPKLH